MSAQPSLANHTLEAFRAQAGIKDTATQVCVYDGSFIVETKSGKTYEARFLNNGVPVAQFLSNDTGQFLNHEEARDLIAMIRQLVPAHDYRGVLKRLESNLPSLRVGETPIMGYQKPQPTAGNAKNWTWALNNE